MSSIALTTVRPAVQAIVHAYHGKSTHLLQMLWRIQEKYSYIPELAIDSLAGELNLPRAQIAGVAGFYSFFHQQPRGQYDILFSDNIIEQMQGKAELMAYMLKKLGVQRGQPRPDGRVTVDNTSCIGMSDQGPAILINGHTITRLTKSRIDTIVDLINCQVTLAEWPKEFFEVHSNIQRKHILLGEYFEAGSALKVMLEKGADLSLAELGHSGLRGCGGAGFKTESKWLICRNTLADERIVICNADEGEPGTFKDRILMQRYADLMFEGMTLCGYIIKAKKGFLYLRGEYRFLLESLEAVLDRRRKDGLLGDNILDTPGFSFDIEIHLGAGGYICGAEIALIESIEGNRGIPRRRPPPFPVTQGYLGKPTVVNNVETFALATKVMVDGAERFNTLGTAQSKGTKLISISGDCDRPGIYEFPFGITVREVLEACGAHEVQAVQNSGAAGYCISPDEFDRRLCFEDLNTTGSFMIFNRTRDLMDMVRNFANFFVHESCGFCTPCRVGTSLLQQYIEKFVSGNGNAYDLQEMATLSHLIKTTSHCGLGMTAANYVQDTMNKFPKLYQKRFKSGSNLSPSFNLDAALNEARKLTKRTDAAAHL